MHVAKLISDAIHYFSGIVPTRHLVDPEESNRALGFPARVTGLYQSYRVLVPPSKVIPS